VEEYSRTLFMFLHTYLLDERVLHENLGHGLGSLVLLLYTQAATKPVWCHTGLVGITGINTVRGNY
jgi:hypothetical protein